MILNSSENEPLSQKCVRRRLDAALSCFVQQIEALEDEVRAGNRAVRRISTRLSSEAGPQINIENSMVNAILSGAKDH
jgi:hypothetical protein